MIGGGDFVREIIRGRLLRDYFEGPWKYIDFHGNKKIDSKFHITDQKLKVSRADIHLQGPVEWNIIVWTWNLSDIWTGMNFLSKLLTSTHFYII